MKEGPQFFDQSHALSSDNEFHKLGPMKDASPLLMSLVLPELPEKSRIFCIGVGTGAESIVLAKFHPKWEFAAVEPSSPMLNVCKQQAEIHGVSSRCIFHEGHLNSLCLI